MDIIEEIVNDQKDERRQYYFIKFLPYVIGIAVFVVILMLGYTYYESRQKHHNSQIGDMLFDIITSDNINNREALLESLSEITKNSENREKELAHLKIAFLKKDDDSKFAQMSEYESIAENSSYLENTRAFARLRWINILLDKDILDEDEKNKARKYIQEFKDKSPFFVDAILLKVLFLFKNGETDLAKQAANEIINMQNASSIIKEQAYALLISIKYQNQK